jgi:hypothetical protein
MLEIRAGAIFLPWAAGRDHAGLSIYRGAAALSIHSRTAQRLVNIDGYMPGRKLSSSALAT